MVNPIILLLAWLIHGLPGIVHGQTLLPCTTQDAHDAHSQALCRHGRSPILPQQTQTDVPIGVHMLVSWRWLHKVHAGRLRRIVRGELDPQSVLFSGVDGILGHFEGDDPHPNVFAHRHLEIGWRRRQELLQLLLDAVIGTGRFQAGGQMLLGGCGPPSAAAAASTASCHLFLGRCRLPSRGLDRFDFVVACLIIYYGSLTLARLLLTTTTGLLGFALLWLLHHLDRHQIEAGQRFHNLEEQAKQTRQSGRYIAHDIEDGCYEGIATLRFDRYRFLPSAARHID
mmetsp:Transcript_32964/g.97289  ORF Transcript_32964/g.97289 Transcript_32964/m.97289 type:complete len:284 (+) Transcript_32964:103-954(+)